MIHLFEWSDGKPLKRGTLEYKAAGSTKKVPIRAGRASLAGPMRGDFTVRDGTGKELGVQGAARVPDGARRTVVYRRTWAVKLKWQGPAPKPRAVSAHLQIGEQKVPGKYARNGITFDFGRVSFQPDQPAVLVVQVDGRQVRARPSKVFTGVPPQGVVQVSAVAPPAVEQSTIAAPGTVVLVELEWQGKPMHRKGLSMRLRGVDGWVKGKVTPEGFSFDVGGLDFPADHQCKVALDWLGVPVPTTPKVAFTGSPPSQPVTLRTTAVPVPITVRVKQFSTSSPMPGRDVQLAGATPGWSFRAQWPQFRDKLTFDVADLGTRSPSKALRLTLSSGDDTLSIWPVSSTVKQLVRGRTLTVCSEAEAPFAGLTRARPLTLMPVRIETRFRFRPDRAHLLVRIFPDALHLHAHDERASERELEALQVYDDSVAMDGPTEEQAFARLARDVTVQRALWLVETRPTEAGEPRRRVSVQMLPERWFVRCRSHITGDLVGSDETEPVATDLSWMDAENDVPWLADFREAQRVGMAVAVLLEPDAADRLQGARDSLDVNVFGVVKGRPKVLAKKLGDLFASHRYSQGLDVVPFDTPTNHTDVAVSGAQGRPDPAEVLYSSKNPATDDASAASILSSAFGLVGASRHALERTARGAFPHGSLQAAATEAVWRGCLRNELAGLVDEAVHQELGPWFVENVRVDGSLPAFRVGFQPYGMLPLGVDLAPQAGIENTVYHYLKARHDLHWSAASVPVLDLRRDIEATDELLAVMGASNQPAGVVTREVGDAERVWANVGAQNFGWNGIILVFRTGRDNLAAAQQASPNARWRRQERALIAVLHALGDASFLGQRAGFERAFVDVARAFDHDRLADAIEAAATTADKRQVWRDYETNVMVRPGRDPALSGGSRPAPDGLRESPPKIVVKLPDDEDALDPIFDQLWQIFDRHTTRRQAWSLIDEDMGDRPWPDALMPPGLMRLYGDVEDLDEQAAADLGGQLLRRSGVPGERLEPLDEDAGNRLLMRALTLGGHRIDRWLLAPAEHALRDARDTTPEGVQIGAWGAVLDLKPGRSANDGFVLAPSMDQARTAGILRAGFEAFDGDQPHALAAIDLSSSRVRSALQISDAVRAGRSAAEVLGTRLERRLKDAGLGALLGPLRAAFKIGVDRGALAPDPRRAEALDGLRIAAAWADPPDPTADPAGERTLLVHALREVDPTPVLVDALGERDGSGRSRFRPRLLAKVERAFRQTSAELDALADLQLAEGVHLLVNAQEDRFGAWRATHRADGPAPQSPSVVGNGARLGSRRRVVAVVESAAPVASSGGWQAVPAGHAAAVERWLRRLVQVDDSVIDALSEGSRTATGLLQACGGSAESWLRTAAPGQGASLAILLDFLWSITSGGSVLRATDLSPTPASRSADPVLGGSGASFTAPDAVSHPDKLAHAALLQHGLAGMAAVRPALQTLCDAYLVAEARTSKPLLSLQQVAGADETFEARILAADAIAPGDAVAGFVVDAFAEPRVQEDLDLGLAVRSDSPQAKAPQCLLLGMTDKRWTPNRVERLVQESMRLARTRAVTMQALRDAPTATSADLLLPLTRFEVS